MEHEELFASTNRPAASHQLGIPYPFSALPAADEPFTDVRLFDTLMPLLEGLAGIASALAVASPDMPRGHAAALRALAAQAEVAPTILRRWWEANHEED